MSHRLGICVVAIEAVIAETEDEADIRLRPFRALRPTVDAVTPRLCSELGQLHDDIRPTPMITDHHHLLRELTEDLVDGLLEHAGPSAASPPRVVDIRHLGGALGRPAPGHGALDRIEAAYALHRLTDHDYGKLMDPSVDPPLLFDAGVLRRLQAAKATFDHEDRFVSRPSMSVV